MDAGRLVGIGILLVVAGMIVAVIGALSSVVTGGAEFSGGLVIFIGPFPVAVGWGEHGPLLVLVGVAILLAMVILAYLMFRQGKIAYG